MTSYIRGWIQMVLAPNDLFSWNNKYRKYMEYNIAVTFTCFFLAIHTTYSVHAGILKSWRGCLPWPPAVLSFYHVLSLPLSGLNWRSLFPPWGFGPPFPKMAPPFTGSTHTPLPESGTGRTACESPHTPRCIPIGRLGVKADWNTQKHLHKQVDALIFLLKIALTTFLWWKPLTRYDSNTFCEE